MVERQTQNQEILDENRIGARLCPCARHYILGHAQGLVSSSRYD